MPRKSKIDLKLKINLVKQVAHHQLSIPEAARKAHVGKTTFRQWPLAYSQEGIEKIHEETPEKGYLSAILDLYDKRIVAYVLGDRNLHRILQYTTIATKIRRSDTIRKI